MFRERMTETTRRKIEIRVSSQVQERDGTVNCKSAAKSREKLVGIQAVETEQTRWQCTVEREQRREGRDAFLKETRESYTRSANRLLRGGFSHEGTTRVGKKSGEPRQRERERETHERGMKGSTSRKVDLACTRCATYVLRRAYFNSLVRGPRGIKRGRPRRAPFAWRAVPPRSLLSRLRCNGIPTAKKSRSGFASKLIAALTLDFRDPMRKYAWTRNSNNTYVTLFMFNDIQGVSRKPGSIWISFLLVII